MTQDTYSLRMASDVNELGALRAFIQETCGQLGVDADAVQDIMLAVNEAATNVIVHGYRTHSGLIDVNIARGNGQLIVTLTDQAPRFDPTTVSPPDLTLPLAMRPPGGMGVHMMRQLMDDMQYAVTPNGRNQLTLLKRVGRPHRQED